MITCCNSLNVNSPFLLTNSSQQLKKTMHPYLVHCLFLDILRFILTCFFLEKLLCCPGSSSLFVSFSSFLFRLFLQQMQFYIASKKYLIYLFFSFLMKLCQRVAVSISSYFTIVTSWKTVDIRVHAKSLQERTFYLIVMHACSLQHQSKLQKRSSDVTTRGMKVAAYYGLKTPPYELVSHQSNDVLTYFATEIPCFRACFLQILASCSRVHLMFSDILACLF